MHYPTILALGLILLGALAFLGLCLRDQNAGIPDFPSPPDEKPPIP